MSLTIGIIGIGSLGEQLTKMLLRRRENLLPTVSVIGSVRRSSRKQELLDKFGTQINLFDDNRQVVIKSDIIILSVKPGQIKDVCKEINPLLINGVPVISAATAIPLIKLQQWLPSTNIIIRCMPNIPCSIGAGVSTYYSESSSADSLMNDIFAPNTVFSVNSDTEVDASTLISGCGPAFFAWYADCLKTIAEGTIEKTVLMKMITETMKGTAEMLQKNNSDEIISAVASPRGATEAALSSFKHNRIDEEINVALLTAQRRIEAIVSSLE